MESVSTNVPVAGGSTPPGAFKVPNVPKVTYQDPQSISTAYGWGNPVDFVLPRTIGKVIDLVLQIDYTTSEQLLSALPPTPYWFERLETSIGGSAPIETVNKDELFTETLSFLDIQDFQTIAPMVNIQANGSWWTSPGTGAANKASGRLFLPLWANCLMTCQPYLKGFNSEWKLRFILSQAAPLLAGSATVTITGLRLLITEAQLPPSVEAKLARQHAGHVSYNTINRLRHLDTKMPAAAATTEYTLTTFGNESAGVISYMRAVDTAYTKLGQRAPFTTINFRDAAGNPYYAADIDGNYNLYFLTPWSVKGEPLDSNRVTSVYLLPFSSHVGAVLQDGRDLGAYQMSGKEKIVVTQNAADFTTAVTNIGASGALTNCVFVAVSYDYMRIKVNKGNARVYYSRA